MANLEIQGIDKHVINGAVDLQLTEISRTADEGKFHMHYGDWTQPTTGGAIQKRSEVDADISATLSNQRLNADGSVTATITTRYRTFGRTFLNNNGVNLALTIHVYASQDRQNEVFTRADHTNGPSAGFGNVDFSYDVTVPARGTVMAGMGHYWNDLEKTTLDDEFSGGLVLFNPNYPDYRPGARRLSGTYESLNRGGGKRHRRVNGQWVEMRTMNGHVGTDNPPKRHVGGQWVNQNKIGANG